MTNQLEDYRRYYAELLVRSIGRPKDQSLQNAFQTVPREDFVGCGPWKVPDLQGGYVETPTSNVEFLYQDILIALDTEKGINNGSPSLHAGNIAALGISSGESIVHVGAGTGYYTAILAELTGASGSVVAYEYEPSLAKQGEQALQRWPQTKLIQGSVFDANIPRADVIYANAGMPQIEPGWIEQLNDRGRLLFPLTCSNGFGVMLLILNHGGDYFVSVLSRCVFIGCVGSFGKQASDKLDAAFRSGMTDKVSRLYLSRPQLRQHILLSGDGWYLCSE